MQRTACLLLAAVPALLVCNPLRAGGFTVDPVHLQFQPRTAVTAFKVTNASDTAELLQIAVLRWAHLDGQDLYQSEPAAMVSPPMFQLAPHASRWVRIRFNGMPARTVARAWKVMIEEAAEMRPVSTAAASPRESRSLPLLLQPAWPRHALRWTAERDGRQLSLNADNQGNAIERVDRLALAAAHGRPTYCALRGPIYLFPGETRSFSLPVHTDHLPSDAVKLLVQGTSASAVELALSTH